MRALETVVEAEHQRQPRSGRFRRWALGTVAGLAATAATSFGQADTIKVSSYDDRGPVNGDVELVDEATAERYQQQSTDGVALFPVGPTGIEDVIQEDHATLAPNPIEDHAFFTHPDVTRDTPVEAYSMLGQLIGIAQPGDDRLEISTKPGLILLSYYDNKGRRHTEKAVVNGNQAIIDIITEDHPAATKQGARLKSTAGTTHTVTWKDLHDGDPKLQNHEQETRSLDINDQESGTLTVDLPLQYTYKQNWIGADVNGATEAVIDRPLSKTVFMPGGVLDPQEFKDRYDLREGLPYSITFTGGPHADHLTKRGTFAAADTITIIDTLVQNYFLEGGTETGTIIDVFSYPDSTLNLASTTASQEDYRLTFKWKGLEKEVLITAEKDDEKQRYVRTLQPGFTTQDLEFGFPIKVTAYDDKGNVDGDVTLLDLGNGGTTTKTSQEGVTIFKADKNSNTPYTHFITWRDLHDGNPKLQNHDDKATGININAATGDTLSIELGPLQYTTKQNWIGGEVIGALEAIINAPAHWNVNMTDGKLRLQRFEDVYDLREGLPYSVTFSGGPHADHLTINGRFAAADTIMVRDTLTQNYALQGSTTAGADIDLFSYPDSTNLLAETVATGNNYSLTFKKKALSQQALLKAQKDGQTARHVLSLQPGTNQQDLDFIIRTYDHWFSNTESTPGTHADWYDNGSVVMSADVNANGDYRTNTWTTTNLAEVVDSVVAKRSGFNDLKLFNVQANEGNNDLQLDLSAIINQYRFVGSNTTPNGTSVRAWENGQNIASATVNGSSYATGNWQSTLTNMNIDSVVFTATGFSKEKFINVPVVPGANTLNAQLEEIPPETYDYRFRSTNSSPNGTAVRVWENGQNIATATVNNGAYTTNDWTSTLTSMNIDSITFKLSGYYPEKFTNVAVNPGNNTQDANLQEIPPQTYEYWLFGSNSTPSGSSVKGWRGGSQILSGTVSGSSYQTNHVSRTSTTLTLDSLVLDAAGYLKQVELNLVMQPNGTKKEFALEEEPPVTYDYRFRSTNSSPNGTAVRVWENGSQIASATVNNGAYTTNYWTSILSSMNIDSITFKLSGYYPEKYTNVNVVPGNNTRDANLQEIPPPTYDYRLVSSNSSPNGTVMEAWDDGVRLATATVSGGGYTSNQWTTTLNSMVLDSITFKLAGYHPEKFTNVSVSPGNNTQDANLQEIPPPTYNYRFTSSNSSPNGTAVRVWENGSQIATATVNGGAYTTNDWTSTLTSMNIDSITFKLSGYYPEKYTNVAVNPGSNVQNANLEEIPPETYNYRFRSTNSSPNGTAVRVWENGSQIATATVNGGAYTTNDWTSTLTSMNIDSITFKLSGYYPEKFTNVNVVPGNNTRDANLQEIPPPTYNYRFTSSNSSPNGTAVRVWENGSQIASATVNGSSYTTNDWTSTLSSMNIDSITFKLTGYYPEKYTNIAVNPGSNVQNANLEEIPPPTYDYWLSSSSSSPSGATVKGWKDGTAILNGTVSGSSYETNHVSRTSTTLSLDSIVVDAAGYIKEVTFNQTLSPNGTNFGFSLEQEQQGQNYTASGRAIDIRAFLAGNLNDAVLVTTSYGTYDGDTDGNGNFTINYVANPGETITITSGATGYDADYIAVRGRGSSSGGGGVSISPGELNGRDVVITPNEVSGDADFQYSIARTIDYDGAFLQRYRVITDQGTGEPATQEFIDAINTGLTNLPSMTNIPVFGQIANYSSDIQTGELTDRTNKIQIAAYTGLPTNANSPNAAGDGTVVYIRQANATAAQVEAWEMFCHDGVSGNQSPFLSGTSTTALGKAILVYNYIFR